MNLLVDLLNRESFRPIKHHDFRCLLTGRVLALFGGAIAPIALAFAVLDLTHSATSLGVVLAARSVPLVLFVIVGGVVADKFPRGRILMGSNLVSGSMQALTAFLLMTHHANILLIGFFEFIGGMSAAFLFPALAGLTPRTVPDKILQQANGLLRLGSNSAAVGGSALAGILIALTSPAFGMAFSAVTYFTSAVIFRLINIPKDRIQTSKTFVRDLQEGWNAFTSHIWVVVVVVQAAVSNAAIGGALNTLGPLVAQDSFGRVGWGLVLAISTAGMLVGAVVGMRINPRKPLFFGVACTLLEFPVLIVLAWKPELWLLLPLVFVAGIGIECFTILWDLSLQRNISPELLSRVSSYDVLGSFAIIPIGQLIAGPLSVWLGVSAAITGFATFMFVTTVVVLCIPVVYNFIPLRTETVLEGTQ